MPLSGAQAEPQPRQKAPPPALAELRERQFDSRLNYERALEEGPGFSAYLLSYRHSGLKLYAMVAVPEAARPADGYPVVIANHGYVPDPKKYGITADGIDARPGDYYRSVPELYTSRGFLVVIPDYRGHNSSQGFDYIEPQDDDSAAYYAEDVVALLAALGDIDDADLDNVFMWSHSMGGTVSLRALLATDIVKASAFWATMNVDELLPYLDELDGPVMIQHSIGDTTTDHANSERLAAALQAVDRTHTFHSVDSNAHFFEAEKRELAADRDVALFRSVIRNSPVR